MIDNGQVASRKELARTLGVSQARVSQLLRLLTLSPTVIDAIVQLGDPLPEPLVCERSLRTLVGMAQRQQEQWLSHALEVDNKTSEMSD
jgi:hypothetical protein